ncbi:MAG TPA: M56 family metallopeptidase [Cyclobacteriaceae bacterium]
MTLVHSLWQGLAITLIIALFLKVFAVKSSSVKYFIKTGAFFLLFASSLVTFFILQPAREILSDTSFSTFTIQSSTPDRSISYLESIINYLQYNQQWIVLGWIIGTLLFSLRFAAGVAYLKYLRVHALPVDENWNNILKNLSAKLGIDRVVQLCESVQVQTPMAMGYLKPIVLMPIGLMAGLSTQQVEVILIHELEHIRRHDYLINFIQSLGETIFFFNPFVWTLSASIRNERENCCDDAVLREGYDPKLYANTLYELEISRLQNTRLALALTGNKNQLLNRIKRIMEHSAKNQKGKEKFIPVVLLVLGLVFASWLSINPKEIDAHDTSALKIVMNIDTAGNPVKTERYSRKSVITYDAAGKPHEEVIETFSGDEGEFDFGFDMPEAPEPPSMAELADIATLAVIPDMEEFHFDAEMVSPFAFEFDTLPELKRYTIKLNDENNSEFEVILKSDFNIKNQAEMEKVMAEVQAKMAKLNQQMASNVAHIAPVPPIPAEAMHEAELAQIHAMEEMRISEDHMKIAEEQMRHHEADLKVMEEKLQKFEKELTELLIKDGYLKKGTKMDGVNFNFTEEGIRVNDQKIKAADEPKYRELNHKYFGESPRHRPE